MKGEGCFRLGYRAFDIHCRVGPRGEIPVLAQCEGGAFEIFSTKAFPGLGASTDLTKACISHMNHRAFPSPSDLAFYHAHIPVGRDNTAPQQLLRTGVRVNVRSRERRGSKPARHEMTISPPQSDPPQLEEGVLGSHASRNALCDRFLPPNAVGSTPAAPSYGGAAWPPRPVESSSLLLAVASRSSEWPRGRVGQETAAQPASLVDEEDSDAASTGSGKESLCPQW